MMGYRSMSSVDLRARAQNAGRLRQRSHGSVHRLPSGKALHRKSPDRAPVQHQGTTFDVARAPSDRSRRRLPCDRSRRPAATPPAHSLYDSTSRWLDYMLAAGILVLFSPLWLTIAAAIKLSSRGPVVFTRVAIGR